MLFVLNNTFFLHLKAGAILPYSRQITVPHYPRTGVILFQPVEEFLQSLLLLERPCICRPTANIQSAFVANADAVAVVPHSVGTLRVEGTARMHYPVARDVVVVADVGKAPVTVVATAVVHGIATGDAGGTTMYHNQVDGAVLLVLATM